MVTDTELSKMIQIHRQLTDEVLREIRMRHLPVDKLIAPPRFKELVEKESLALERYKKVDKSRNYTGYDALIRLDPENRNHMLDLLKDLISRHDQFSKHVYGWVERAAREIAADQDQTWRQLLEITEEHLTCPPKTDPDLKLV